MAAISVTRFALAGIVAPPTTAPATGGGDTLINDGKTLLYVNNAGGSPITVTITSTVVAPVGATQTNQTVTVANGVAKWIGPFLPTSFNDPTANTVAVGYSAVTSVGVAAVGLP